MQLFHFSSNSTQSQLNQYIHSQEYLDFEDGTLPPMEFLDDQLVSRISIETLTSTLRILPVAKSTIFTV